MADYTRRLYDVAISVLAEGEELLAGTACSSRRTTGRRITGIHPEGAFHPNFTGPYGRSSGHTLLGRRLPENFALAASDCRLLVFDIAPLRGRPRAVTQVAPLTSFRGVHLDVPRHSAGVIGIDLGFFDDSILEIDVPSEHRRSGLRLGEILVALIGELAPLVRDGAPSSQSPPDGSASPPGWYPDLTAGIQRWWDGHDWSDHIANLA